MILSVFVSGCSDQRLTTRVEEEGITNNAMQDKLDKYTPFGLSADLSHLSENQKMMIPLLIEAGGIMDKIFWSEAFGDKDSFLKNLSEDEAAFATITQASAYPRRTCSR